MQGAVIFEKAYIEPIFKQGYVYFSLLRLTACRRLSFDFLGILEQQEIFLGSLKSLVKKFINLFDAQEVASSYPCYLKFLASQ